MSYSLNLNTFYVFAWRCNYRIHNEQFFAYLAHASKYFSQEI